VQDPDRIETEEVLFVRAEQIHPDVSDVTLDEDTSHFRAKAS
jgi:hypothetical protein